MGCGFPTVRIVDSGTSQRPVTQLTEKGGKHHEMPVHHTLEEYLDSYIEAAGLLKEPKSPLFRASNGKTKVLSDRPFERRDALKMVQRRTKAAGIKTKIGCHTFRATGITTYLTNGAARQTQRRFATSSRCTGRLQCDARLAIDGRHSK
jgi:site-specific recombinase XerD